jgi:hypothetical protein
MGAQIRPTASDSRPGRVSLERLAPEIVGHAKGFLRTQARDSLDPIRVFTPADRIPIAVDEFPDASCDHSRIVPERWRLGVPRVLLTNNILTYCLYWRLGATSKDAL